MQLQSDLLDGLETRPVAPLLPPTLVPPPMRDLHPRFDIEGETYLRATQLSAPFGSKNFVVPSAPWPSTRTKSPAYSTR